jgi:hypothetical protein
MNQSTPRISRQSKLVLTIAGVAGLAVRKHGIAHDPAGPLLEGRQK